MAVMLLYHTTQLSINFVISALGYLHVVFLAGTLGWPIQQWTEQGAGHLTRPFSLAVAGKFQNYSWRHLIYQWWTTFSHGYLGQVSNSNTLQIYTVVTLICMFFNATCSSLPKDHKPFHCTLEGRGWWYLPLWESQADKLAEERLSGFSASNATDGTTAYV